MKKYSILPFLALLSAPVAAQQIVFDPSSYAAIGAQTAELVESIGIQAEDLAVAHQAYTVITDELAKLNELYDTTVAEFEQLTELYTKTTELYAKTEAIYDNAVALYDTTTLLYEEGRGITEHGLMLPGSASELRTMFPALMPTSPAALGSSDGANSLREQLEVFTEADIFRRDGTATKSAELYKAEGDMIFGYMALTEEIYNGIGERRETLAVLTAAIGTAETQKTINDLNARINAENTLMMNDIAQLQAIQVMVDLQKQNVQRNQAAFSRHSRTSASDINFLESGS